MSRPPAPSRGSGAKRWCFTLNNYTDEDEARLHELLDVEPEGRESFVEYAVYGREEGESGTPHLQGFIMFKARHNFVWMRNHVHDRAHFEVARGTPHQASEYCKKEDDYDEFGELPSGLSGNAKQFDELRNWAKACEECPSERDVADAFPALWIRYRRNVMEFVRMYAPQPHIQTGELRGWQIELKQRLDGEPDDRTIIFCIDREGNVGKSFFIRWMVSRYPEKVQVLGPGRRDDLAHCVHVEKSIFLFNIPRGSMEHLNYGFLESLKDRMILSPKYDSQMKFLKSTPHVVVMANEDPDQDKLSADRYDFFDVSEAAQNQTD